MSDDVKSDQPADDAAVYVISVAAEISGLHPQTLRQYDRLGLVSPNRTEGRNRRYSLRARRTKPLGGLASTNASTSIRN